MIGKLVKGIGKLGLYGVGIAAVFGAWDFFQQSRAEDGQYTMQKYATSVSDRYGEDASRLAHAGAQLAVAGYDAGVAWAIDSGVLEKIGLEAPEIETPDAEIVVSDPVEAGAEPLLVASADPSVAPDSSLFPRARATK